MLVYNIGNNKNLKVRYKMKYFKRFTDVISGVALLNVVIYLIGKFSIYMKNSDMTFSERLESFLEPKATGEYRTYFFIAVFLILSIVGGRIFERFPTLALAATLPPLCILSCSSDVADSTLSRCSTS